MGRIVRLVAANLVNKPCLVLSSRRRVTVTNASNQDRHNGTLESVGSVHAGAHGQSSLFVGEEGEPRFAVAIASCFITQLSMVPHGLREDLVGEGLWIESSITLDVRRDRLAHILDVDDKNNADTVAHNLERLSDHDFCREPGTIRDGKLPRCDSGDGLGLLELHGRNVGVVDDSGHCNRRDNQPENTQPKGTRLQTLIARVGCAPSVELGFKKLKENALVVVGWLGRLSGRGWRGLSAVTRRLDYPLKQPQERSVLEQLSGLKLEMR